MRSTRNKTVLMAAALLAAGLLGAEATTARAQVPRGGGFAGSPTPSASAPARKPRVSTWSRFKNFLGGIGADDTGKSTVHKNPFTGRDELPGGRPWMSPSR